MAANSRFALKKIRNSITQSNIFQGWAGKRGAISKAQAKYNEIKKQVILKSEDVKKRLAKESISGQMLASGRAGKSIVRQQILEAGELGTQMQMLSQHLTDNRNKMREGLEAAFEKVKAASYDSWSSSWAAPLPGILAPEAAQRSTSAAFWADTMSVVGTAVGVASLSDSRLKEDIKKVGQSISGYNIYKFKYLDSPLYYYGVMAEEVLAKKPEAVGRMDNGYFGVDYNQIDVEFREVANGSV